MVDVEEFFRRYGPMVVRRCRQLLHDEEKAIDASQDVFVQLVRHHARLREAHPISLLYRIATNVCLNVLRTERRHPQTRDDGILLSIVGSDDSSELVATRDLLDRIFGRERETTRVIAVLHFVDRMTLEETATAVGLSVSAVRKRLQKLKERSADLGELD